MVENHTLEWIGVITLFLLGVSLMIQGYFVCKGKFGYRNAQREKIIMQNVRKQIEKIVQTHE